MAWEQLSLVLVLRELDRDVDTPFDFPARRVVAAADAPRLQVMAPASVWEAAKAASQVLRARGRFGDAAGFAAPRYGQTVRDGDVTRHTAMRHDETEEWAERERQRRARQRPPKPPKGAKTRGKRVRAWDGEGDGA